jgi:hypothetical protein
MDLSRENNYSWKQNYAIPREMDVRTEKGRNLGGIIRMDITG